MLGGEDAKNIVADVSCMLIGLETCRDCRILHRRRRSNDVDDQGTEEDSQSADSEIRVQAEFDGRTARSRHLVHVLLRQSLHAFSRCL